MNFYNDDIKQYRKFFNSLKIQDFRKIVFVSDLDKKVFIAQFPELIKNTVVCNNLIDYKRIQKLADEKIPDEDLEKIFGKDYKNTIKNDASQDLPSAVITLEDNFAWNIIKPNDYVKIEMNYRSDAFETDVGHINNTCLFAGLVSDVRESFQGSSNQRMYTVTVQGLAKILQNVQLATFTEATQLSAYALLPDDAKKVLNLVVVVQQVSYIKY